MSAEATVSPILEMRGIAKSFPGVRALSGVSFAAYPGEIHALMGENGAGKSTLMKILSGAYRADPGGEILVEGAAAAIDGPQAARRLGIAVIYQELALAPNLSVAENMMLGREPRGVPLRRAALAALCRPLLARLGVAFGPETLVGSLSAADQQLVEIARALLVAPRILVMDEPTTSLSSRETDRLFALIRQMRQDGLAVIYISHRMAEVYELADRVSVLRDGALVGTLTRRELSAERLVSMMVGRPLSSFYTRAHAPPRAREVLLAVRDLGDGRRVHGCSFDLHAGEVLGIAGLVGAGRTELARLIYGAEPRASGSVTLDGRPVPGHAPRAAIAAGIVYLTEDRKRLGLFLDMTLRDNITMDVIGRDARFGLLARARARARAFAAMQALRIRAAGDAVRVGGLSGGNQQKALLARLLETRPRVLLLDEPTRGVDIGAKSEIYRLIDALAGQGAGVVVISSELPEILGIADRALVMRDGQLVGEVAGAAMSQEAIIALATNAGQAAARAQA
jgi:ribose transport system ATP-binding protein